MSSISVNLPRIVRVVGHFAAWVGYYTAAEQEPSRPPARLAYHTSTSEPARCQECEAA
jgi:hypothetical protein